MQFNKYKDLGDYHWKEYKKQTPYRKHVNKLIQWIGEDTELLDLGAGDGLITSLFTNCLGVENNKFALDIVKQKKVNVIFGDLYNLINNLPKKQYKNILMGDVIEHLQFPKKVLLQIRNIIDPKNGLLFISTPPKRPDGILCDKYHYAEYDKTSLENLLKDNGFVLCEPIEIIDSLNRMYGKFKYEN